jgi:hypothetical protein
MIGKGKLKYLEKTCPSAALSTTNPICCPDRNPAATVGSQRLTPFAMAHPLLYVVCRHSHLLSRWAAEILLLEEPTA